MKYVRLHFNDVLVYTIQPFVVKSPDGEIIVGSVGAQPVCNRITLVESDEPLDSIFKDHFKYLGKYMENDYKDLGSGEGFTVLHRIDSLVYAEGKVMYGAVHFSEATTNYFDPKTDIVRFYDSYEDFLNENLKDRK